jgi:hypothetical protein
MSESLQARVRTAHLSKKSAITFITALAVVGLCAFQFGDRYGLNSMPFAQVQPLVSDLARAQRMAKRGNIELHAGQPVRGEAATLRGELTDASCYLGNRTHGYDHAFCAKFCVAAGSPLVFVPDQGGQVYLVLNQLNGVRLPETVLDQVGVPGVVVKGKTLDAEGLRALAVEGLAP